MFRILSLDGGGIKGAFTASVLAAIEDEINEPIGEYFDLIAGTSTGGILALGLGFRIWPKRSWNFIETWGLRFFRRLVGSGSPVSSANCLARSIRTPVCARH
jgi:patatin-like phospholipase/acyl hydrolase